MYPTMDGCDVLLYGPGEPEEDAIMMFWHEETLFIHRLVEDRGDTYVFQGDNRAEPDGEFTDDDIQAKVYTWIDIPVPFDACVTVFKPLYNAYYNMVGLDRQFHSLR